MPHWQHEVLIQYTAAADLPSTSQRQISHSLKWAVSSTTPALLSALRDSVSPPVPSVSSLTSDPQSPCLILQTCLTTSGHLALLSDLGAVMLVYRWDYSHSRQAAESETPTTFFLHLPQKTASLLNLQIAIVLGKKTQNQFLFHNQEQEGICRSCFEKKRKKTEKKKPKQPNTKSKQTNTKSPCVSMLGSRKKKQFFQTMSHTCP